jgi:hypothetical protein
MSNDAPYADWIRTTLREASIRRGLVLYGNVRDIFYDPQQRQHVTLPELLVRLFVRERSLGFTMAGVWDQVDGLRFPDSRALNRFHDAVRRGVGGNADSGGDSYDVGDTPSGTESRNTATGLYPNPNELLPAIRAVVDTSTERPVFILDWTHLLVTQPAHPDTDERRWMLQLAKMLIGDSVVPMDSDHLRQNAGLVVLLTANLGALPPILYQGDPRIRLVSVPAPSRPERRSFVQRHFDDLRCELPRQTNSAPPATATVAGREELVDNLADLTDRLTFTDLRQILSLSIHTPAPLRPERLLNLYRFGEQRSPWEDLSEEKLRTVEETIKRRVVGQDRAVQHVGTMIIRAYMGLAGLQHSARRAKPKGTLFFVGPTGVGKTELAKACAEFLFGDESACIRFDMSEYNHEHSDQRLVGAPPGYVGFEEGGQLTNAVRERPFSVLLFDEIEKAHGRVLDKFLQILEDGRLTDGRGETTHFSECVIIFTSNIGSADMPNTKDPGEITGHFVRAVEDHFISKLGRPELLNRLGDNVVVFQPITDDGFRRTILEKKIAPLHTYLQERFGAVLRLAPELEDRYLRSARSEHGGRGLINALERDLLNPLARFLFERKHQLCRGRAVSAVPNGDGVVFEIQEA